MFNEIKKYRHLKNRSWIRRLMTHPCIMIQPTNWKRFWNHNSRNCKQNQLNDKIIIPPHRGGGPEGRWGFNPLRLAPLASSPKGAISTCLYSIITTYGSQRKISKYSPESPQTNVSFLNHSFDILSNLQTSSNHRFNSRIPVTNPSDKLQRNYAICLNLRISICSNLNTKKSIWTE